MTKDTALIRGGNSPSSGAASVAQGAVEPPIVFTFTEGRICLNGDPLGIADAAMMHADLKGEPDARSQALAAELEEVVQAWERLHLNKGDAQ